MGESKGGKHGSTEASHTLRSSLGKIEVASQASHTGSRGATTVVSSPWCTSKVQYRLQTTEHGGRRPEMRIWGCNQRMQLHAILYTVLGDSRSRTLLSQCIRYPMLRWIKYRFLCSPFMFLDLTSSLRSGSNICPMATRLEPGVSSGC